MIHCNMVAINVHKLSLVLHMAVGKLSFKVDMCYLYICSLCIHSSCKLKHTNDEEIQIVPKVICLEVFRAHTNVLYIIKVKISMLI